MLKLAIFPGLVLASLPSELGIGTTVLGILISVTVIVGALYGVKYRVIADQQGLTIETLTADRDTWKDMADQRAKDLEATHEEKQAILKAVSNLKEEKARLEALPNLSIIIEQMSKEAQRAEQASQKRVELIVAGFADAMKLHEDAAAQRHAELIQVLAGRA